MILADTIKGLTISIGADTKTFNKQLKQVDKDIKETERQADALTKSLQLEFDAGRFSQAQKLAQEAIEKTDAKAQALREQLKYLENTGADRTSDNYKKLETQLYQTEAKALTLREKLNQINDLKLNQAIEQVQKVGDNLTKTGQALMPFSVAATGVISGLTGIGLSTIKTADDIATLATQVGISSEKLQEWQYIAMQTDVSDQQLQTGLMKIQAAMADVATGVTGPAAEALEKLGISAEDASKGMDANFEKIIHSLSSIEDPIQQAALANELFGDKLGSKLLPLLKSGGEGLNALSKEFQEFGYMTNEQISELAEFDNVMNKIKYSFKTLINQIGVALLPVIQSVSEFIQTKIIPSFKKFTEWIGSLDDKQKSLILGITAVVAVMGPLLMLTGKLVSSFGSIIKSVKAIKGSLDVLAKHPIIAIISVIVGILILLYTQNEQFRESVNALIDTLINSFAPILETIIGLFTSVYTALMPILNILLNMVSSVLSPILSALVPILNALTMILVPTLNAIMTIIQPLITMIISSLVPAFEILGKVVSSVFGIIPKIINNILKFIEKMVNSVIDFVNKMIRAINKLGGWIGISLNELDHIYLKVSATVEDTDIPTVDKTIPSTSTPENVLSSVPSGSTGGIVNNDYSHKNITITVNVENYAEELDIDNIAEQINLKLAQQM